MTGGCPACDSTRPPGLALALRDARLVRCRACTHVRVDPMPTPGLALAAYDEAYFRGGHGYRDYAGEEPLFRAEFRRRLVRVLAVARPGRLVDVGAATGAFLAVAAGAGFAVRGVEPSPAAAVARARGFDVARASVADAELPSAGADVVTIFDALEHVVTPADALARVRAWLRPGGLCVVTVPDFGGWWARLSGARWPMISPTEHLHYFTRRSLRGLLRRSRFEVSSCGLAGTPVSLGTVARKAFGPAGAAVERLLGPLAGRGGSLPFGTLFAIARRVP